jgi:hypothetical protein
VTAPIARCITPRVIPSSHHGTWRGPNRLWLEGPAPERSEGSLQVDFRSLHYEWQFRGEPQRGSMRFFGPAGSLRVEWVDTFHAKSGMQLHGHASEGVFTLYGTYPAGDDIEWGWRIALDTRDPEHLILRMFNLPPSEPMAIAVDLFGAR